METELKPGHRVFADTTFYPKSTGRQRYTTIQLDFKKTQEDSREARVRAARAGGRQWPRKEMAMGGSSRVREAIWDIPRGRINSTTKG